MEVRVVRAAAATSETSPQALLPYAIAREQPAIPKGQQTHFGFIVLVEVRAIGLSDKSAITRGATTTCRSFKTAFLGSRAPTPAQRQGS